MDNKKYCDSCKDLSLDKLGSRSGYQLHPNIKCLRDAAQAEPCCAFCSLIWWSLRYDHQRLDREGYTWHSVRLFLNPPLEKTRGTQLLCIEVIVLELGRGSDRLGWAGDGDHRWLGPPEGGMIRSRLTLYGINGTPTESLCRFNFPNIDPGSDICMSLLNRWLKICEKSHPACNSGAVSSLPRRVIDTLPMGIPNEVRLIDTEENKIRQENNMDRYVALSYCWGQVPFLNTTTLTIKDMKKSIPLDQLPQTIKDAIYITRRLNIRYLWVDSICIVQGTDDFARTDWNTESAKMKDIYQNAFLTISAASAVCAHVGILKRRIQSMESCPRVLESETYPNLSGEFIIGPDYNDQHRPIEPLDTRAWAYQEGSLSTRAVIYGSTELSWVCHCATRSESRLMSEVPSTVVRPIQYRSISWKEIVQTYSIRDLTRSVDRLPALAGVAKVFAQKNNDQYLAGLWKRDLLQLLLWEHRGTTRGNKKFYSIPTNYQAPSWSWASVNGAVIFHKALKHGNTDVLDCTVSVSSTGDCYIGPITGGKLRIRGSIKKMLSIRCAPKATYYGAYENYPAWRPIDDDITTYLDDAESLAKHPNAGKDPLELTNCWFLKISSYGGLILMPTTKSSPQRRVEALRNDSSIMPTLDSRSQTIQIFKRRVFQRVGMYIRERPEVESVNMDKSKDWRITTVIIV